jgi:hypothetical protein
VVQIILGLDFGCRVGKTAKTEILFRHSKTVVYNPDSAYAPIFNINCYFRASRVDGVIQKFPDNGSRTVDNFSRGDSPGNGIPKDFDGSPGRFFF